jgi:hypothetical protein
VWLLNGPNSDWIARDANSQNNGPAPYTFSTSFNLTGYDLATVSLAGSWAIDDGRTIDLNGRVLGSLNAGYWRSLTGFSASFGSGLFVQGVNTLSITMTSNDLFLDAVGLDGSVSITPVPEPSSLILVSAGVAGLAIRHRRKWSGCRSQTSDLSENVSA